MFSRKLSTFVTGYPAKADLAKTMCVYLEWHRTHHEVMGRILRKLDPHKKNSEMIKNWFVFEKEPYKGGQDGILMNKYGSLRSLPYIIKLLKHFQHDVRFIKRMTSQVDKKNDTVISKIMAIPREVGRPYRKFLMKELPIKFQELVDVTKLQVQLNIVLFL